MYAEAKAKAHNCKVLIRWLASVCYSKRDLWDGYGAKLAAVTFSIADFCHTLDRIRHWKLSPEEAQHLYRRIHDFLSVYKDLALSAVRFRKRLYGLPGISITKRPSS